MKNSVPVYQAKAELFRTLGHPLRIRILELLLVGPTAVRDLLADVQVEQSNLSQQLAVLRRSGLVTSSREGATVRYTLADHDVADLLAAARQVLASVWEGSHESQDDVPEVDGYDADGAA